MYEQAALAYREALVCVAPQPRHAYPPPLTPPPPPGARFISRINHSGQAGESGARPEVRRLLSARVQACNVALGWSFAALPDGAESENTSAMDHYVAALTSFAANDLGTSRSHAQAALESLPDCEALCLRARIGALMAVDCNQAVEEGLRLASALNSPMLADQLVLPMLTFKMPSLDEISWVAHWPPHPANLNTALLLLNTAGVCQWLIPFNDKCRAGKDASSAGHYPALTQRCTMQVVAHSA